MPYGKIIMDNETEILFEIDEPFVGQVSAEGIMRGVRSQFDAVLALAEGTAKNTALWFKKLGSDVKPDELEISFGAKLTADAGVAFAKAGTEGTFKITLTWKHHEQH